MGPHWYMVCSGYIRIPDYWIIPRAHRFDLTTSGAGDALYSTLHILHILYVILCNILYTTLYTMLHEPPSMFDYHVYVGSTSPYQNRRAEYSACPGRA